MVAYCGGYHAGSCDEKGPADLPAIAVQFRRFPVAMGGRDREKRHPFPNGFYAGCKMRYLERLANWLDFVVRVYFP